mmetsp:Transcript_4339/g.12286  ORF Transcript_4339/g.12286 Transcript_4339/m.12286 type:complete len:209 (+) Transcript_4339:2617-3243(+)
MHTALPLAMPVPENNIVSFDCSSQCADDRPSTDFCTVTDSPVNAACSTRKMAVFSSATRQSAGTRSPAHTSITSPGTSPAAPSPGTNLPPRITLAVSADISLSASSALSAFDSCHTPTIAFKARISRITPGSTNAPIPSSPSSPPSMNASPNDTAAASSKIFTSVSSNCSSTIAQSDVGSGFFSAFGPCSARRAAASGSDSPFFRLVR